MKQNNVFSPSRWALLLKKDFFEGWKGNTIGVLALFAILIAICLSSYTDYKNQGHIINESSYWEFICCVFFVLGCVYASKMLEPMNSKTKSTSYLMLPGSVYEKYCSRWILPIIIYPVLFIILFFLADVLKVGLFSLRFPEADVRMFDLSFLMGKDNTSAVFRSFDQFALLALLYLFTQSLFMIGSAYWKKSPLIKTCAAMLVCMLIYIAIFIGATSLFFEHGMEGFGQAMNHFSRPTHPNTSSNSILILCVLTLMAWGLAFLRFKESEIN